MPRTPPTATADEDLWHRTLAAREHWCSRCEEYRVRAPGTLCPVCLDDDARRSGPLRSWRGGTTG